MSKKMQFSLSDEAAEVIDRHAESERKRGELVSRALIEWESMPALRSDLAAARAEIEVLKNLVREMARGDD